jgi:hypothetical protein
MGRDRRAHRPGTDHDCFVNVIFHNFMLSSLVE